jgi:hypothetical protein
MDRGRGVFLALLALLPGVATGVTFAAAVNLYYEFHPAYFAGMALALALAWWLGAASLHAFGVRRALARWLPLVIVLALTSGFFALAWVSYPDRSAAARKHRVLLRSMPVYPGAGFAGEETWGRYGDDLAAEGFINPPAELLTTWTWRLPKPARTAAVADWYEVRLKRAGWQVSRDDAGADTVLLLASRGALADPLSAPLEVDVYPRRTALYGKELRQKTSPAEVTATAGP